MKSSWLWIVGIVIAVLTFVDRENDTTSVPTKYEPPAPLYYPTPRVDQQLTIPTFVPSTFLNYPCTADCSGHEAGYEWAEKNGIDDPEECSGNSNSFIEGCQAYAEEQQSAPGEGEDEE